MHFKRRFFILRVMKIFFSTLFTCCSLLVCSQSMKIIGSDGNPAAIEKVLQDYIRIPSVSGQEREAGEYLKLVCSKNGLHITDFGNEEGMYNFAASVFPLSANKPNIIFLNHLDVVPESEGEEREPYSGKIENNIMYGRGSIDNKGAAMIQLYGILQTMQNAIDHSPYNITFLSVSCEETQCSGGMAYVKEHYMDKLNAAVVFGEGPSELTGLMDGKFEYPIFGISVVHKRPLWLTLELESKTNGHGSITPNTYANKEMIASLNKLIQKKPKAIFNDVNIKFLKDIGEHHRGIKKMVLKHPKLFKPFVIAELRKHPELFSLFSNTITLTNIYSNSDAVNKLSSVAGAYLDCRLLPETDENEFLEKIRKKLKNDDIKVSVINSVPKIIPSDVKTVFYKNMSLAIQEKYPNSVTIDMMMPNVNDLGLFRLENIPAYGTLPIFCDKEEIRSVHGKNEHLHLESLHSGAEVFYNFLSKMINQKEPALHQEVQIHAEGL